MYAVTRDEDKQTINLFYCTTLGSALQSLCESVSPSSENVQNA